MKVRIPIEIVIEAKNASDKSAIIEVLDDWLEQDSWAIKSKFDGFAASPSVHRRLKGTVYERRGSLMPEEEEAVEYVPMEMVAMRRVRP